MSGQRAQFCVDAVKPAERGGGRCVCMYTRYIRKVSRGRFGDVSCDIRGFVGVFVQPEQDEHVWIQDGVPNQGQL